MADRGLGRVREFLSAIPIRAQHKRQFGLSIQVAKVAERRMGGVCSADFGVAMTGRGLLCAASLAREPRSENTGKK